MCVPCAGGGPVAASLDETLLSLDRAALKELLLRAMQHAGAVSQGRLPDAVVAGQLSLVPREEGLAPKDIPVDTVLHKITMMRDKLRLAEQRINASDAPTAEKLALQAQLTEAYRVLSSVAALLNAAPDTPGDSNA